MVINLYRGYYPVMLGIISEAIINWSLSQYNDLPRSNLQGTVRPYPSKRESRKIIDSKVPCLVEEMWSLSRGYFAEIFDICHDTVDGCWWKKSCTSWYGKYPLIYRLLYISGGAGFLHISSINSIRWRDKNRQSRPSTLSLPTNTTSLGEGRELTLKVSNFSSECLLESTFEDDGSKAYTRKAETLRFDETSLIRKIWSNVRTSDLLNIKNEHKLVTSRLTLNSHVVGFQSSRISSKSWGSLSP